MTCVVHHRIDAPHEASIFNRPERGTFAAAAPYQMLKLEDTAMRHTFLLAAALTAFAGIAQAQSPQPSNQQQQPSTKTCAHPRKVAITDEYGFRYDARGDRLNAQGCVVAPPHTPPGARAIQD